MKTITRHSFRPAKFIVLLLLSTVQSFAQPALSPEQTRQLRDTVEPDVVQQDQPIPEHKHVYRMNYWVSGTFSLAATAANLYAIPNIIKAKRGITDAELAALNPDIFSGFDRWALEQDPTKRDINYRNSDILLPALVVGAGALAFDKEIKKDWLRILMMYYETHAVTFSLYNFSFFGPAFQNKIRPYSYYNEFPAGDRQTGNQRNSLYSGHTASAAAATFFMVKVYSDYHPELGSRKYLWYGVASVPALLEGYLRMKALAHFPSDIMVGFAIGAVCGVVVPDLHKFRQKGIQLGLSPSPYGSGAGLNFCWTPTYERKKTLSFQPTVNTLNLD